ncbi:MAG: ECF-type sigma factor, partial [Polyangiaceae bacterium]
MAKEDVAVRELVSRVVEGDAAAEDRLADTLYHQLRGVARRHLASERAGHTLSATALVHEAYLKLVGALILARELEVGLVNEGGRA